MTIFFNMNGDRIKVDLDEGSECIYQDLHCKYSGHNFAGNGCGHGAGRCTMSEWNPPSGGDYFPAFWITEEDLVNGRIYLTSESTQDGIWVECPSDHD